MKLNKALILLAIAIIIGSTVSMMFYSFYYINSIVTYDMSVVVGNHIGFDTDTDLLAFGMIMPGSSSSTRFINLDNYNDYPLMVEMKKTGEIAGWVTLSKENFIMDPHSNITLSTSAAAPPNAQLGNHTGKIRAVFKRVI
ncbi:MAG: hypothetical protein NT001_01815 [Candidatus Woesearchaeota archaeon]|nr:hypothetical protein [Candidatus Woesearchaeota archaeon]